MSADESNVSKSTFSDGATFDVGTALEDGAFDLDNGPFFEDGTAFDDVLLIDDFALEDGTFDFDDAPFFEDGATFFDALFNDDFALEDGRSILMIALWKFQNQMKSQLLMMPCSMMTPL